MGKKLLQMTVQTTKCQMCTSKLFLLSLIYTLSLRYLPCLFNFVVRKKLKLNAALSYCGSIFQNNTFWKFNYAVSVENL